MFYRTKTSKISRIINPNPFPPFLKISNKNRKFWPKWAFLGRKTKKIKNLVMVDPADSPEATEAKKSKKI